MPLNKDVEQKRLHIIIESLVVKKHLRQQAQVLTIKLAGTAIDLKHRQIPMAVDLIAWWRPTSALLNMPLHSLLAPDVL
jgi:hypothetical protein